MKQKSLCYSMEKRHRLVTVISSIVDAYSAFTHMENMLNVDKEDVLNLRGIVRDHFEMIEMVEKEIRAEAPKYQDGVSRDAYACFPNFNSLAYLNAVSLMLVAVDKDLRSFGSEDINYNVWVVDTTMHMQSLVGVAGLAGYGNVIGMIPKADYIFPSHTYM